MEDKRNYITFKNSRKNWRITWLLGIVALIIYYLFSLNWYHFYLYFFLAGIFSLIYSFFSWGKADSTKLTLYIYKLFRRVKVTFPWEQIDSISKGHEFMKEPTVVLGGNAGIPITIETEAENIEIVLKGKIEDPTKFISKKTIRYKETLSSKSSNKIIISKLPDEGIDFFLCKVKEFTGIEIDDSYCKKCFLKRSAILTSDIILALSACFFICNFVLFK